MRVALAASLTLLTAAAVAEPIRGAAAPPAPTVPEPPRTQTAAPQTPQTPEPQRTTATFEDWTLRCVRPERSPAICEVSQTVSNQNQQPVAQTAIGRPVGTADSMRLTVLVPTNILIATAPRLVTGPAPAVEMGWRRCLSNGCVADAQVSDQQVKQLRELKETGHILYQDAAGREMSMPFSPKGLPAALDALAKEPG